MVTKMAHKTSRTRSGSPLLFLAMLFALIGMAAVACGVESGDRRSARPAGQIEEFHRSPVTAFEQFRIDLARDDQGNCTTTEEDIQVTQGQRIRLALQLTTEEIAQGTTGSIEVTGERDSVTYQIPGLEISASGGALGVGVTSINLTLEEGSRNSYDFNLANVGTFDVLCDGEKIATLTVTESSG